MLDSFKGTSDEQNSNLVLSQVADAIVCALEQLCSKDDSDSDEEDTDHIRDYAYSLTAPEINMTPNSSPISPAIVRKSVSKPRTHRYSGFVHVFLRNN